MRPGRVSLLALAILVAVATLVWSAAASAEEVYEQGGAGQPFTFSTTSPPGGVQVTGGADQSLSLARVALADFDASAPVWVGFTPDPRMAVPLKPADAVDGVAGHVLVTDRTNEFIAELDGRGAAVWRCKDGVDGAVLKRPFSAVPVTWKGRRCVLVAQRAEFPRVIMIDKESRQVVWQYGTGEPWRPDGPADQLHDPFTATWVGQSQTVLIADNNDGHRVIEVRASDYRADESAHGFDADSIVWSYGTGVSGDGVNQLMRPRSPQRLPNGDTLIADALAHRVIVVRTSDYDPGKADSGFTQDSIVWEFKSAALLGDPNMATRLADGTTLIADCGDTAPKILWVGLDRKVESLDMSAFDRPASATSSSEPRSALVDPVDGSLVTSDSTYTRVLRIGNHGSATAESPPLDCGKPSMIKRFDRLSWTGWVAPGQSMKMWYSVNGGTWRACTRQKFDFPSGTAGKRISYRVVLTSTDRWTTPVFEGFSLMYDRASRGPTGGGGGGATTEKGANSGADDGVYTYPGLSGTGTTGGGTGAGSSGYGSGAGTSGTGTGGATSGAPASSAGAGLVAPPTSVTGGAAQSVTGVEVQGVEGVSGIPLTAAAGAHVKEEQANDTGHQVTVGVVVVLSLSALAALFIPWPVFAANLREIGGFDHTRPRRLPRFRHLGR